MVYNSPESALRALCESLPSRPIGKDTLDRLIDKTLEDTPTKHSSEVQKSQWELALKSEIFALAVCCTSDY